MSPPTGTGGRGLSRPCRADTSEKHNGENKMRVSTATILTALLLPTAALLSGCGSSCVQLGSSSVSTCGATSSSTTPANSISGGVSGNALQGVQVSLTGPVTANATTGANGTYSFPGLPAGNYTVTPSLTGYTFNPSSSAITLVSGAASSGNNFVETAYTGVTSSIAGKVTGTFTQIATLSLSGASKGSVLADASGNYSFTGLAAGGYTVTPSLSGYVFNPASLAVTTAAGDAITAKNFTATVYAGTASSLSGSVSGAVAQNVTITLSGANTGSVLTDENGKFTFTGLAVGTYTVTPSLDGYSFTPANRTLIVTGGGNFALENFTAAP